MAEVINFENIKETPKFDPKKKYTWNQDVNFTISGRDFGLLLNTLRAITGTKEAQTILLAHEAGDVLENTLANAVEAGIVVELPENKASL